MQIVDLYLKKIIDLLHNWDKLINFVKSFVLSVIWRIFYHEHASYS